MDQVTLQIYNLVGSSLCVDADDGQRVYESLSKILREGKKAVLSFLNVELLTSAFLNTAVGQVYRDFPEEQAKRSLSVENMSSEDVALLKRVIDTAKLYYKDPGRMEASIQELLGEV